MSNETSGETTSAVIDLSESLAAVLASHKCRWLKFVEGLLGSRQDAEDVLQEAVRRVLVRGRKLPSDEEVRLYLGRAISNTAIEVYNVRKRHRLKHSPLEEESLCGPDSPTPLSCLEALENSRETEQLLEMLKGALARLPHKQQEALYLTILEPAGCSIRDAGLLHGIPYSTLRHRSLQALKRLRKSMIRALKASGKTEIVNVLQRLQLKHSRIRRLPCKN